MSTTRSQGLPAEEAPEKTQPLRPRKKKTERAHEAPEKTKVPRTRKKKHEKGAKVMKASQAQPPSSVAESPLFKLPPELRTMIYRFALIDDQEIAITESGGFPEPELLSVCKTVRSEAYKVFYYENIFCCVVEHFSPVTLLLAGRRESSTHPSIGIGKPVVEIRHE